MDGLGIVLILVDLPVHIISGTNESIKHLFVSFIFNGKQSFWSMEYICLLTQLPRAMRH